MIGLTEPFSFEFYISDFIRCATGTICVLEMRSGHFKIWGFGGHVVDRLLLSKAR